MRFSQDPDHGGLMAEIEFFFEGYPVGTFLDEWRPDQSGVLAYMPYRGPGHFDLQKELKKSGVAKCYCDIEKGRQFFEVRMGPKDGHFFEIGNFSLSKLPEKNIVSWLAPWVPTGLGAEKELEKEVGMHHPLFQVKCIPIARRVDRDEILFEAGHLAGMCAVVQLTWSGKSELDCQYPRTEIYKNIEEWIEKRMKKDHEAYMA